MELEFVAALAALQEQSNADKIREETGSDDQQEIVKEARKIDLKSFRKKFTQWGRKHGAVPKAASIEEESDESPESSKKSLSLHTSPSDSPKQMKLTDIFSASTSPIRRKVISSAHSSPTKRRSGIPKEQRSSAGARLGQLIDDEFLSSDYDSSNDELNALLTSGKRPIGYQPIPVASGQL